MCLCSHNRCCVNNGWSSYIPTTSNPSDVLMAQSSPKKVVAGRWDIATSPPGQGSRSWCGGKKNCDRPTQIRPNTDSRQKRPSVTWFQSERLKKTIPRETSDPRDPLDTEKSFRGCKGQKGQRLSSKNLFFPTHRWPRVTMRWLLTPT